MEWILIIIFGALVIGGSTMFFRARSSIFDMFRTVYGNKSLKQVVKEGEWVEENVPKSVSSATSIYLPLIIKDFPDFSWNEFQQKAKNVLKCFLLSMSNHDTTLLPEESNHELREQVRLAIQDDENGGMRTFYDDITIHKVEIVKYRKQSGTCVILLQASVGYLSWQEKDGNVMFGSKDKIKQTIYELELIYIQDYDKVDATMNQAKGVNCPNCGAPIKNLGAKFCEYCGLGVVEFNIKVWSFGIVKEKSSR